MALQDVLKRPGGCLARFGGACGQAQARGRLQIKSLENLSTTSLPAYNHSTASRDPLRIFQGLQKSWISMGNISIVVDFNFLWTSIVVDCVKRYQQHGATKIRSNTVSLRSVFSCPTLAVLCRRQKKCRACCGTFSAPEKHRACCDDSSVYKHDHYSKKWPQKVTHFGWVTFGRAFGAAENRAQGGSLYGSLCLFARWVTFPWAP